MLSMQKGAVSLKRQPFCFAEMEKGCAVVAKTFAKENPPYVEHIEGVKRFGLAFLEKYICVNSNEYIVKKNLVEELVV